MAPWPKRASPATKRASGSPTSPPTSASAPSLTCGWGQTAVRPRSDRGQTGVRHPEPLLPHQQLTVGVIAAWIVGALALNLSLGFAAFAGGVLLVVFRAAEESETVKRMPWGAILMVCGVSVLVNVLEKTGGMALFTGVLAQLAAPGRSTA